jgi:hypothetical protein
MKTPFRLSILALTALLGTAAFAQPTPPYPVTVAGIVLDCTPNGYVNITTNSLTQPAIDIDVPLDANCGFSIDLLMDSFYGGFVLSTPCNGAIQQSANAYQVNALEPDSTYLYVVINCTNSMIDCVGIVGGPNLPGTPCNDNNPLTNNDVWSANCLCEGTTGGNVDCLGVPGGSSLPGTACTNFLGVTGIWTADCICDTDTTGGGADCLGIINGPNVPGAPCQNPATGDDGYWSNNCVCVADTAATECSANFWVMQAYTYGDSVNNPGGGTEPIPNEVWVWNLTSGGQAPYTYLWSFGDGTSSTEGYPTHFYANGGPYQLCLTIADAEGCTSTYCDEVSIDENGIYTGLIVDGRPGMLRSGFTIRVITELPTGVDERNVVEEVAMWPNPVEDIIGLSFTSSRSANLGLSIMDLNGRVIRTSNNAVSVGNNRHSISVADLDAGMYLLQITDGTQSTSRRFVKN